MKLPLVFTSLVIALLPMSTFAANTAGLTAKPGDACKKTVELLLDRTPRLDRNETAQFNRYDKIIHNLNTITDTVEKQKLIDKNKYIVPMRHDIADYQSNTVKFRQEYDRQKKSFSTISKDHIGCTTAAEKSALRKRILEAQDGHKKLVTWQKLLLVKYRGELDKTGKEINPNQRNLKKDLRTMTSAYHKAKLNAKPKSTNKPAPNNGGVTPS